MFKKNYYCLIAGLPDLILNETRKGLTSLQFRLELLNQLNKPDYKLLELLYRQHDNKNLINLLLKQELEFDDAGNYSEDYLISQILSPTDIVEYMKRFILEFKSESFDQKALYSENRLQELFYSYIQKTTNPFIQQWFKFDHTVRNILTAVNCRKYGYETEKHLIPDREDKNGLFDLLLKGSLRPDLFVDEEIPHLEKVLQIAESALDASEKEKAIDNLKWIYLDEITVFDYFTMEKILSFVIKLNILDRWRELDDVAGKAFLEKLINDLEMSYSFSEEFSLTHRR